MRVVGADHHVLAIGRDGDVVNTEIGAARPVLPEQFAGAVVGVQAPAQQPRHDQISSTRDAHGGGSVVQTAVPHLPAAPVQVVNRVISAGDQHRAAAARQRRPDGVEQRLHRDVEEHRQQDHCHMVMPSPPSDDLIFVQTR